MSQRIVDIDIADLVLWTENPRDPIDATATDQNIVERAFSDRSSKWALDKLAKEMGDVYDLSELPTVVYHGSRPVVYDGNRRVILVKLSHNLVTAPEDYTFDLPKFPRVIPCNVCSEDIALMNVYRKHGNSGSWQPLERDFFLNKFMKKDKSTFLLLEDATGIISSNPHLNQRFVKEEIFKDETLKSLGFQFSKGKLYTYHSDIDANAILADISQKVKSKVISTRHYRGKIEHVLEPSLQQLVKDGQNRPLRVFKPSISNPSQGERRATKRTTRKDHGLFGGRLYLRYGIVSDIYRDIDDLFTYYVNNKSTLSQTFPGIVRMSLRLLCEQAAKDEQRGGIESYVKSHFDNGKDRLSKDVKTTLATHNVTVNSLTSLLQIGAHGYQTASNIDQTIAMSLIIGAMLTISHGKDK